MLITSAHCHWADVALRGFIYLFFSGKSQKIGTFLGREYTVCSYFLLDFTPFSLMLKNRSFQG